MGTQCFLTGIVFLILASLPVYGAGLLERLGFRRPAAAVSNTIPASLSHEDISAGLKQALSNGIDRAITTLGREDGFLKDPAVKIPMPQSLDKIEKTLRALRQDKLADDFVATMNRAAEKAVPEAVAVLGDSLKQMSIADARTILFSTNNAATDYFRRTSETNILSRFLPIVAKATEETGVTSTYKTMTAKASGGFGKLGGQLLGLQTMDVDQYVAQKAMEGLFLKIGEEEKKIRENPSARATDLLKKVFGAAKQSK